ncbi:DUF6481 family protein [Novosphingobium sp.]|jgi:23S rRNA pseudoU1915 N3-methylase RlmH|uniref:DUF6481 family protein n=1 Tax=Novosphingobium sp. TaxID=1874826 RepID=UPI0031D261B7
MTAYKEPGFQDRIAVATRARESAIARLKTKPATDPAQLVAKAKKALEREAAQATRLATLAQARRQAKAEKLAKQLAKDMPAPTEAERKAIRDARYAARKARTSSH